MKISSVPHNQMGSRTKITHSFVHPSSNYFCVSTICQTPLWMLSTEGCVDFSYTGPVSKTWTSSSPCDLTSLRLSICGAICLGQATVHHCLVSYPSLLTHLPAPCSHHSLFQIFSGIPTAKEQEVQTPGG